MLLTVGCFCFGVFLLFQPVPDLSLIHISRFSAVVSFTAGFAACRACGFGFRFLNNGFHLLFRLGLPLQGCVEILCLVRPLFRPQEHTADDLSGHHFQGLAVPLIHGEQKEREHDDNHAERGGAVAGRASEQKEKRYRCV